MDVNKIYNENCLDTLARIPDKTVALTVTSPPYNMRLRVSKGKYISRGKEPSFSNKYSEHFNDALPIEVFFELHKKIITELLRVSKVVCYNFQIVTGSKEAFFKIIGTFSSQIKDIIVWDKKTGQPAMHPQVLNSCYEMILVMEDDNKKGRAIQNSKFKRGTMDNIIRIGRGKKITSSHGAVFPEQLPCELIECFSEVGDLIYDPFSGTGTTALIASRLKRNFIGSEISEKFFTISEERLNKDLF